MSARNAEHAFKGQFKCTLCPRKVLRSEADLAEHLTSKNHKLALKKYYKANEKKFKASMWRIKQQVKRRYLFNTPKLQKLARIGIHYKLLAQLQV